MTKLYRYTSIENTFGWWVFSAFVFALLIFAPGEFPVCADSGDSPIPAIQSGTSLYLQEQLQRLQEGKKISVDPEIVPADFWNPSSDNSPQDAYRWPTFYFGLDPDRNDTNGNGLRECRVKIDLSGFVNSGVYSAGEVLRFETELRSVIALYNAALKNVGLEFLEVNNGSQHLTIEAIPFSSGQEGVVSLATLFGAWSGDTSVFQIRSDYPNFNALLDLTNNGAPTALFRRPPGNPYAHVFSEDVFTRTDLQGNPIFAFPISNVFLRELGHLIGLMDPSIAYLNASAGALESYLIDWLAWPTIKGTPPKISGLNLGGENFSKSQWSGVFMNSFMNGDSLFYQIYPDLTPPVKAFIAHYYARYDYGGAQVLLNQAIQEHNTYSWLANGKAIQEVESNNNPDESFSVSIGKPVLGALSSFDPAGSTMGETQQDVEDWYKIRFVTADLGRELVCTIGHATSIDRAVRLELYNSQGVLLAASSDEEYAEIRQTVQSTGIHYVAVKRPANPSLPGVRDYLLSIFFSDGQPPFGPTSTPTPTVMPTATPTPIAVPVLKGPLGESILGLGPVQSLAYSPDGLSIATAGGQGLILWSADTGAPTRRFGSHTGDVLSVAFSPNGSMLASCSRDGTAKVWDLTSGAEIVSVTGHAGAINAVVFSQDNGRIITAGDDKTVKVWEIQTGGLLQTYTAHRAAVNTIAVSPDGKNVLTGSKDNSAKLWDLATGNTLRTFTGHLGAVQSVAFSPNGETVLTGSLDTTAKLWSVQTGAERASFKTGSINSVAFSSDGVTAAIGSNAGAKLANLVSGTFTKTLIEGNTKVLAIGFSPNGTRLAVAGSDNSVKVFDVVTGQVVQSLKGHTSIINTVAYSPDSQRIVSSGGDNVVRIWDKSSGAIVRSFETSHTGTIASVAFSPDGLTVLTGSEDGTAILWDAASGEAFRIFSGHTGGINAVAFTLDGNQIVTAGNDGITRLWDIASGKSVRSFSTQQSAVKAVSILPDGTGLIMGNTNGAVTEWSFDSVQSVQSFDGLGGALLSLAISSDGATIAGGYQDQIVRIWNRAARSLHSFYSAKGPVTAVAFSPIKPWVLVAGGNEIRLWHLSQTYLISVFDSHVDQINSLAFAPDGRSFASGSSDGTLRVWNVGGLVDATPTPTPTSTPTPTFTPTNTPTFTPTFTRTPTPTFTPTFTPTPTPVWVDVPVNTIYVTDDMQTTENLLGETDLDSPTDKMLAVRWNIPGENILDYHVYVRTNNGDPVYIGQTRNPSIQYFKWKEPQFGNFYSFVVFALVSGASPIIVNTDKRVFYQTSESPTPTPTKVPVFFDVPANTIVVTDDIWSTENLVGSFDRDDVSERFLTIRWNIQAEDIVDYHIYTRINDGDAVYLGRTGTPSITYFNWTEPQFNNRYRFIVFGLRKELPYAQITAAGEVFYQSVVNPTPTPTSTASPTPTPTKTPVPFTVPPNRIYVTDDLGTTENLIGLFDKDDPDDRALGIRWNVPDPAVTDFHVYVSVNGSTEFFLGRTGSGEVMQLDWRENGPGISKMFSQGPQFSNSYGFTVFGIRPDQTPTLIRSESVVLFEQEGSTLPTATPTPTVTPTPRMAPNSVIVADNVDDFLGLTSGEDYDIPSRRDLVVRWNFAYKDVTDYHIYVSVNSANAEYLGRTASGTIDYFEWKINSPRLNPKFWNGPEFGNTYQFYLYAVRSSGSPSHYGPFTHKGAIRFMEWVESAPGS